MSTEQGPFQLWLLGTTQTSAAYSGQAGRTYAFYSVATDNVGRRQVTPDVAQARTTVEGRTGDLQVYLPLVIR